MTATHTITRRRRRCGGWWSRRDRPGNRRLRYGAGIDGAGDDAGRRPAASGRRQGPRTEPDLRVTISGARSVPPKSIPGPPPVGDLVERAQELDLVRDALAGAADGRGAFVVFRGAAGLGKSTLLSVGADAARSSRMVVLSARGSSLESHIPFGLARKLVGPMLRDAAARERLLAGDGALATPLFAGDWTRFAGADVAIGSRRDSARYSRTHPCRLPAPTAFRWLWFWTTCNGPTRRRCGSCWPCWAPGRTRSRRRTLRRGCATTVHRAQDRGESSGWRVPQASEENRSFTDGGTPIAAGDDNDTIRGDGGRDAIDGGAGTDCCDAGSGADPPTTNCP